MSTFSKYLEIGAAVVGQTYDLYFVRDQGKTIAACGLGAMAVGRTIEAGQAGSIVAEDTALGTIISELPHTATICPRCGIGIARISLLIMQLTDIHRVSFAQTATYLRELGL